MSKASKVVLITGGSRGIGQAAAEKFKAEGYQVVTCSSRAATPKGSDLHLVCDVSSVDSVKKTIQATVAQFGHIDVLVNNAGLSGTNPMDAKSSDELWHKILDVNLSGSYYFSKYALPHLREGGRIVNIASVLALKGVPDQIAYCSAKHGVVGLTRSLAHFVAPRKITVNAICPGWTRTEMAEGRFKEIGVSEAEMIKMLPLGRISEPSEIAAWIYFLTTEQASGMTGQTLTVDSGWLA